MSENEERWRMFCAIELPEDVRARAADHIARLRGAVPHARASWERAEKLHITLKFLGEIEPQRTHAPSLAAARAAALVSPFNLAIEGAGAFPTRGVPRVLWIGVTDSAGRLAQLQKQLEDECASENFARDERPFHPHLTIARLRAPQYARRLAALHKEMGFEAMGFDAAGLVVVRSELSPRGSRYTTLSHHTLGAQ